MQAIVTVLGCTLALEMQNAVLGRRMALGATQTHQTGRQTSLVSDGDGMVSSGNVDLM